MRVAAIREQLLNERSAALDTRDPLAIRRAGDRFKAISSALAKLGDDDEIDPRQFTVSLREAARALGHNMRDVQTMARDGRLVTVRVRNEWRVPLSVLL